MSSSSLLALSLLLAVASVSATCGVYFSAVYYGTNIITATQQPANYYFTPQYAYVPLSGIPNINGIGPYWTYQQLQGYESNYVNCGRTDQLQCPGKTPSHPTCTAAADGVCTDGITLVLTMEAPSVQFAVSINGQFLQNANYTGASAFTGSLCTPGTQAALAKYGQTCTSTTVTPVTSLTDINSATTRIFGSTAGAASAPVVNSTYTITNGNPALQSYVFNTANYYGQNDNGMTDAAVDLFFPGFNSTVNPPAVYNQVLGINPRTYEIVIPAGTSLYNCNANANNLIVVYTFYNGLPASQPFNNIQPYNTAGGDTTVAYYYTNTAQTAATWAQYPNQYVARSQYVCQTNPLLIPTQPTCPVSSSSSTGAAKSSSSSARSSSSSTGQHGQTLGDPQFNGLRGQSFQVHGIDGAVYAIISDAHFQLNSQFVFLSGPRDCPIIPSTNKKSVACWSHQGSYLGLTGLVTSGGDRIRIVPGNAATGFASVTINDVALAVGESDVIHFAAWKVGNITRRSSHEVVIESGMFRVELENNNEFLNIVSASIVKNTSSKKMIAHGLLGQTWKLKKYSGQIKEIEGEVDDYMIASNDIFGNEFLFNRFGK